MEVAITNYKPEVEVHITNFDEVKNEIVEISNKYKDIVVTDENEKDAKDIRAKLNKLKKAIDDRRKEKEKELKAVYEPLKREADELISIIDIAEKNIANQINSKTEKEKELKANEILKYWESKKSKYKDDIDYDKFFNESWLNKTYDMKKVQQDIDNIFTKVEQDINCIEFSLTDKEIINTIKYIYFSNIEKPTALTIAMEEAKKITEKKEQEVKEIEVNETITKVVDEPRNYVSFKICANRTELLKIKEYINSLGIKVERA